VRNTFKKDYKKACRWKKAKYLCTPQTSGMKVEKEVKLQFNIEIKRF